MDQDSSAKFIGSLTKFLQSLCNGYVEFQRGVELVGHIYLNIDTGEKVDYVLHERVSKNDENSVSFVSNSFHAQQPVDKDKTGKKEAGCKDGAGRPEKPSDGGGDDDDDDDDDIMIVDHSERMVGSTNMGTVPNRGMKRSSSDIRSAQHAAFQLHHRNRGNGGSPMSSQSKYRQQYGGPSATVTNENIQQDNINIGDVKLEQLSADDLLSLASQVDEGPSSSHMSAETGQRSQGRQASHSLDSSAGQPVWIKQEAPDDSHSQGGHDTGWPRGRDGQSDSSNSGSDLYPVMMHHNPAYSSSPVFPGFSSSTSGSHHHGHSQPLPGMSGAANPYTNPMSGTSHGMGGIDPAAMSRMRDQPLSTLMWTSAFPPRQRKTLSNAEKCRRYRERLKNDPEKLARRKAVDLERLRRIRMDRMKQE